MHKDHVLLYQAGEMEAADKARFEAHLRECSGCSEWLEAVRGSSALAAAAVEEAPPAALQAVLRGLEAPLPGASGVWKDGGAGAGRRVAGTIARIAGLVLAGVLTWFGAREAGFVGPDAATPAPRLEMPEPSRTGAPRPAPSASPAPAPAREDRMRLEPPAWGAGSSVPAQQGSDRYERVIGWVDCDDPARIVAFKRFVNLAYNPDPAAAEEWAVHVCGERARAAGSPEPAPPQQAYRMLDACPAAALGGTREDRLRALIPNAQRFHEEAGMEPEQALRLAEGICGG